MSDGIAVGAIACVLLFATDKILGLMGVKLNFHPAFYIGIFAGNIIFHALIKPQLG